MPTLLRVLGEPFGRRSWREFGYALAGFPLALAGFVFSVLSLTAGSLLMVTFVGLPLLAAAVAGASRLGAARRALAAVLLGVTVTAPAVPLPRSPGPVARLGAALRDAGGWRAHGYLLCSFPVAGIPAGQSPQRRCAGSEGPMCRPAT